MTKFRADINGLRAWAVVAVIAYHFGIRGLGGGFVGVDVFFVISGFLMTSIIVRGLEEPAAGQRAFSVWNFYLARARRIVPALVALCAVLMVLGWFFLSMGDYRKLGAHTVGALGFFSNILFWREAGYFDEESHGKFLLHTWSLSVEWQFYLALPLVLVSLWKLRPGRKSIEVAFWIGLVASLALSIVLTRRNPTLAFYLLPTRAWELLAGGLVFLQGNRLRLLPRQRQTVELLGFGLIAGAILLLDASSQWPGWLALVPVTGTVLVLIAGRQSRWTGTRVAQWLGECSYSLYLWHWPVVVVLHYTELSASLAGITAGLVVTLVLGRLSYTLVERHSRVALVGMRPLAGFASLGIMMAVVALPGSAVFLKQGVAGRLSPQVEAVFAEANNKNPRFDECFATGDGMAIGCTYGGPVLGAIVLGDSHSASVMRSVEKALPDKSRHVLDWSLSGCPTMFGIKGTVYSTSCAAFLTWALEEQKKFSPEVPLIIVNRTSTYVLGNNENDGERQGPVPDYWFDQPFASRTPEFFARFRTGIIDTACAFAKTRTVYLMRPFPEMKLNLPKTIGRALVFGQRRDVTLSLAEYQQRQAFVWEAQDAARAQCGVKILDPLPYFCGPVQCSGSHDGMPIYFDDDHPSERGGALLVPMFAQVFGLPQGDPPVGISTVVNSALNTPARR